MKTYTDCLQYLGQIQNFGIKFGLDNVKTVLKAFQDPHKQIPAVVVAGSNGKGSVCAMLARVLTLHGYKTGLYTSPHLVRYEERIRIGSELISEKEFCRYLSRLRDKINLLVSHRHLASHPTHFELLTCLALLYFQESQVDISVLEVGMGGRLDATNIVEPEISVITTISFEHKKYLGDTLSRIASEKAGIIKTGVPVICGTESPVPRETIRGIARQKNAPFLGVFDREECYSCIDAQESGYQYIIEGEIFRFMPSLQGEHQGKNAAVAIAAAVQLSKNWNRLDKEKIVAGIESTVWEGRLEVISRRPYILVDGAHNAEGAAALKEYIQTNIPGPVVLVFAVMSDKEIMVMAEILFPLAKKILLVNFPMHRAASPEDIFACVPEFSDRIEVEPNIRCCIEKALEVAGGNGAVVIAGSLFLVGEAKKYCLDSKNPK